jgi:hypothetical protein
MIGEETMPAAKLAAGIEDAYLRAAAFLAAFLGAAFFAAFLVEAFFAFVFW